MPFYIKSLLSFVILFVLISVVEHRLSAIYGVKPSDPFTTIFRPFLPK